MSCKYHISIVLWFCVYLYVHAFPNANATSIKHGDIVFLFNLKVCNNGYAYRTTNAEYTRFTISKPTMSPYQSINNTITTGKPALLKEVSTNRICDIEPSTKLFRCTRIAPKMTYLRVLDKHGDDGKPLVDGELVKFRMQGNNVDCNARSTNEKLQCRSSATSQSAYQFVVVKVV